MEQQRTTDKLAGYLINLGIIAFVAGFCWYFRSVLVYVILAFVVSLISHPLMRGFRKVRIRGKCAPDWLLAILCILMIVGGLILVITQVVPVVVNIFKDASIFSNMSLPSDSVADDINAWVVGVVPTLGKDFDAVGTVLNYLKGVFSDFSLAGIIGSVASAVSGVAVGLFSVVFISFFFVKDDRLFGNIVAALTPDRLEAPMQDAIGDVKHLLSRYFVGLIIEMAVVALVDFAGLWAIARVGFRYSLGIAFIAGLLNVIPYIGPLLGELLGVLLCLVLKYGAGVGLDVPIWLFAVIVLAIMLSAQLVDNFVLQPLIYSSSIQATPLEIFIVILIAGHIGGAAGMLAAIPAYTVVRVIAGRFFYDKKLVKRLMPDMEKALMHQKS